MNLNDLESDERAELAGLYIRHIGDVTTTSAKEGEVGLSPTRHFIKGLLECGRPDWTVLTDEEILACLQVGLHGCGSASDPWYYTATATFLDWLADETRGWPVLVEFFEYFEPGWYLTYLKELVKADEDREQMHRADGHASMQGVAGECNGGPT